MASTMDATLPSVPGSYCFQYDHNRKLGRSQNIFQPPAPSPTPSHRYSQIPRPASRSSNSHSSRKRPRLDTNTSYFSRPVRPSTYNASTTSTPLNLGGSYDSVAFSNIASSTYSLEDPNLASPSPLANSEYRLAGGVDTPSASLEQRLEELAQDEAEKDHRFNRYTTTNTSRTTLSGDDSARLSAHPQGTEPEMIASNSKKRNRSVASPAQNSGSLTGWGIRSTAWALTGGLAGKVFNFCINTAFRGFQAGGGDSYQLTQSDSGLGDSITQSMTSAFGVPSGPYCSNSDLPGQHLQEHDFGGFIQDYMNSPESRRQHRELTPTANHFQWESAGQERSAIRNDWQIIDQINFADNGDDLSPVRKRSRASIAGSWQRPSSRNSIDDRVDSTSKASYASSRARPTSGTTTGTYKHHRTASTGPSQQVRRSRPSFAPSRRSNSCFPVSNTTGNSAIPSPERPSSSASARQYTNSSGNTGLSPDVMSYKRKMKAREKVQDDNLKRLNAQLRDMIREGKEALGSKVEIFDDYNARANGREDFDEGYYEDGWK